MDKVKTVKLPHFEIEYLKVGKGKRTLILVPGLSREFLVWIPTINELKDEYTIYAIKLPAYATNIPRNQQYLLLNQDQILDDFIDHFQIRAPILAGHSLGSIACLQYAVKHPDNVAKLILVSLPINAGKPSMPRRWQALVMLFVHTRYLDSIVKHSVKQLNRSLTYLHEHFRVPSSRRLSFVDNLFKNVPPRSLAKFYRDLFNTDLSHLTEDNTVNTLCIFGQGDRYLKRFTLPPALRDQKNYSLVWLEGGGHYLPRELPQQVAVLIEDFVNS
jgi:pimeloyl-ACP methyl ester carboxylesterase